MKTIPRFFSGLILLAGAVAVLSGCTEDRSLPKRKAPEQSKIRVFEIGEASQADLLFLCPDESYAMLMMDDEMRNATLYYNSSCEAPYPEGTTVVFDRSGYPSTALTDDGTILFGNFREKAFDAAYIDTQGNVRYFWNLEMDASDLIEPARQSRSSSVWEVREGAAVKMLAFGIVAVNKVKSVANPLFIPWEGITLFAQAHQEGVKAGRWEQNDLMEFISDIDRLESYLTLDFLDITADQMILYADRLLENAGTYDAIYDTFDYGDEWQIKPSAYNLRCTPEAKTYTISVDSKTIWKIDDSGVDKSWCRVYKEGDALKVSVENYEETQTRYCNVTLRPDYPKPEIASVTIAIVQDGIVFNLSPAQIRFDGKGGTKTVHVETNERIASWEITAPPTWCTVKRVDHSFSITVEESAVARSGNITVTAYPVNSIRLDKTVEVIQTAGWDGTTWDFTGRLSAAGMVQDLRFGLYVADIARNRFTLSGDLAALEAYASSIALDENGRLVLGFSFEMPDIGVSQNLRFVFTRLDSVTASGTITGTVTATLDGITQTTHYDGSCNGRLVTP